MLALMNKRFKDEEHTVLDKSILNHVAGCWFSITASHEFHAHRRGSQRVLNCFWSFLLPFACENSVSEAMYVIKCDFSNTDNTRWSIWRGSKQSIEYIAGDMILREDDVTFSTKDGHRATERPESRCATSVESFVRSVLSEWFVSISASRSHHETFHSLH